MGLRFLIDLLAKTNLVSTKKFQLNELIELAKASTSDLAESVDSR
jgi:hypothetical protein